MTRLRVYLVFLTLSLCISFLLTPLFSFLSVKTWYHIWDCIFCKYFANFFQIFVEFFSHSPFFTPPSPFLLSYSLSLSSARNWYYILDRILYESFSNFFQIFVEFFSRSPFFTHFPISSLSLFHQLGIDITFWIVSSMNPFRISFKSLLNFSPFPFSSSLSLSHFFFLPARS